MGKCLRFVFIGFFVAGGFGCASIRDSGPCHLTGVTIRVMPAAHVGNYCQMVLHSREDSTGRITENPADILACANPGRREIVLPIGAPARLVAHEIDHVLSSCPGVNAVK